MNHIDCPINRTLEIIGGKWKPIILHFLAEAPRRSGELGRLVSEASGKMLIQQLRELERDGVIRRKVYRQVPPKVEYMLTPVGESLRPIMDAMCAWGREHGKQDTDRSFARSTPARHLAASAGKTYAHHELEVIPAKIDLMSEASR